MHFLQYLFLSNSSKNPTDCINCITTGYILYLLLVLNPPKWTIGNNKQQRQLISLRQSPDVFHKLFTETLHNFFGGDLTKISKEKFSILKRNIVLITFCICKDCFITIDNELQKQIKESMQKVENENYFCNICLKYSQTTYKVHTFNILLLIEIQNGL